MEELFEILIVVAIAVIGITSRASKGKKEKEKKAAASPAQVMNKTAEPAKLSVRPANLRQNITSALEAFAELADVGDGLPDPDKPAAIRPGAQKVRTMTSIEAETAAKKRAEIIRTRVLESISGESPVDEHGCIGGSMPEHTAEGESLAEHAAHERERRQRLAAENTPIRAEELRKPSAQDLRRAVVMSEVLDRPVALRKRRI